jgi:dihydroorotate dehydrogenase
MIYRSLFRPILFSLSPETAHEFALKSLTLFSPKTVGKLVHARVEDSLAIERFGLRFSNPIGLAAGFDKNGIALQPLAALGFGHIEAGTVTFHPQSGNPRPRLFRLPKDKALINRAGFNNHGAAEFVAHVKSRRPECVLGVSIGKSKIAPIDKATEDYLASFDLVYPVSDYIAINVSSPNTPQLRELQQTDHLSELLGALQKRNRELAARYGRTVPLLVKLSPDIADADLESIVDTIQLHQVDGIIATNTTVTRDGLQSSAHELQAIGDGGLSGFPLKSRSTSIIARIFQLSKGRIPIIGVGGIFTAADAWEKICAGASLVQLYTGFIYQGPTVATQINEGLIQILRKEGLKSIEEAIGCNAGKYQ